MEYLLKRKAELDAAEEVYNRSTMHEDHVTRFSLGVGAEGTERIHGGDRPRTMGAEDDEIDDATPENAVVAPIAGLTPKVNEEARSNTMEDGACLAEQGGVLGENGVASAATKGSSDGMRFSHKRKKMIVGNPFARKKSQSQSATKT